MTPEQYLLAAIGALAGTVVFLFYALQKAWADRDKLRQDHFEELKGLVREVLGGLREATQSIRELTTHVEHLEGEKR